MEGHNIPKYQEVQMPCSLRYFRTEITSSGQLKIKISSDNKIQTPARLLWEIHSLIGVDFEGCLEVVAGCISFSVDSRAIA